MKRTVLALVFALLCVALVVAPVEAILFDSGLIVANQALDLQPGFMLEGNGVRVSGFAAQSQVNGPQAWFAQHALDRPIDLSAIVLLRTAMVTGALIIDAEPFTISLESPVGVQRVFADTPFSIHGTVQSTNGLMADVLGEGMLHFTGVYHGSIAVQDLQYSFGPEVATVPEPTTLLLVGSGLVAAGIWRRRRSTRPPIQP